jgi:two-component system response regulator (stage 0 sporulation protein A)
MDFIVIEDEKDICEEYNSKVKNYPNLCLIYTTGSEDKALCLVNEYQPQAIVLDLELHKGTGNGISFLQALKNLEFPFKSFILVVTNNISPVTHNIVRSLGADFVITKNQQDYSVDMVLGFLSSINDSVVFDNKKDNQSSKSMTGNEYKEQLIKKITTELDLIGVSPKLKGRQYLRDAIEITCKNKQTNICALIAGKYFKSDASVERAMQNAINHTWRNTDIETLEKNYTTYINPKKGVPTITEFIYYYADKVMMNL